AAGVHQLFDVRQAAVAGAFELVEGDTDAEVGVVQLLRAAARGPLRHERRQYAPDLVAVDAVGARVRAGAGGELDLAAGHRLGDDPGDVADLEVLVRPPHVERFVVDDFARGVQRGDEGARDVFDVDDGAPGRAV